MPTATNCGYQSMRSVKIRKTKHASERQQQRGIGNDQIDMILKYGKPTHDHRGATIYMLTDKAFMKALRALESAKGCYVVISDDPVPSVVTVGHRYS